MVVFWYHVFAGGHHAGMVVIDNARGGTVPIYSFSGGPEEYGNFRNGGLRSRSGLWEPGTQDFGKWDGSGVILRDDDAPIDQVLLSMKQKARILSAQTDADYAPVPLPFGNNANSNSRLSEFIVRIGLEGMYDRAIEKRGGTPWLPGWGKDVWP